MATLVPSWSGAVARGVASARSTKRIWKAAVALSAKLWAARSLLAPIRGRGGLQGPIKAPQRPAFISHLLL